MTEQQRDDRLSAEEIHAYRDGYRLRQKPVHPSGRHSSPAAISPSEMLANAGITDGEIGDQRHQLVVEAAVSKVGAYPCVGDENAPTIIAGRGATHVRRVPLDQLRAFTL